MDREVRAIEREERKLQREIRKLAKKGHVGALKPLARELVASKKAKERLWMASADALCKDANALSALDDENGQGDEEHYRRHEVHGKLINMPETMETIGKWRTKWKKQTLWRR